MRYKVELLGRYEGDKTRCVWFDDLWLALQYFNWKANGYFKFTSSPPIISEKAKLYKGRRLVLSIGTRKNFYPYFLKLHRKVLTKEEHNDLMESLYYNNYMVNGFDKKKTAIKALECHKEIFADNG